MPNAILATFSDAKAIKGRSVFQIVLEIPIEEADKALKILGGWPQPAESRWVGVALAPKDRVKGEAIVPEFEKPKDRRPFNTLPLSQQAVLRCKDAKFWDFLSWLYNRSILSEEAAAKTVRVACAVASRGEFNQDHTAAARWKDLDRQFSEWMTDQQFAESMR